MKLGGTIFKAIIRHLNTHGHIISNNSILKILFNFKVDTKDDIRSELQKLLAEEEQVMAKLTKEVEHSALQEKVLEVNVREDHVVRNGNQNGDHPESGENLTKILYNTSYEYENYFKILREIRNSNDVTHLSNFEMLVNSVNTI